MFEYSIEYLNDSNQWTPLRNWTRPIIDKITLDETHDESQIFLSCSELDKPFKPFTRFIINIVEKDEDGVVVDNDTLYRVVISDEIEQVRFGRTKLYNHDIRLAEASKELERYIVDNLSFTNAWNKAFQETYGGAFLTNVDLHDDWYVAYVPIPGYGDINYLVQQFTEYNSDNAYMTNVGGRVEVPIDQTYIAKTLFSYNTPENFKFNIDVPSAVIRDNYITIPSLTVSNIQEKHICYHIDPSASAFKYDAFFEFRNIINQTKLIAPNGTETNVNSGDSIQLTELGRYILRFSITRQERTRVEHKMRSTNWFERVEYFGWYNGITTTLEFEIFCLDSGAQVTSKLSVYDILNKLIQCTPTRFNGDNILKFSLFNDGTDKSIFNRYANKEAPEMILTNKNLWEALREIGGTINAIPYLHIQDKYNWNVIDFMQLGSEEKESTYVEQNYCNSQSYYDSENFTAAYDMSIDNMINPVSTKEGYISESGYKISKSIRSEEVEISETSMCIQTNYPIYKIESLKYVNYNLSPTEYELINNVLEKALYDTLVSNTENSGKAVNLYFTQGKPNIYGLQYKISANSYAAAVNKISIKSIIKTYTGIDISTDDLLQGKFVVRYVPYLNARIRIYKPNAPKLNINTAMFQNQSANVVDARALGRKMVANIGRVGNLGYVDSLKVYHLKNIPLKGQRSADGYFVGTITTEYDRHHLLSAVQYTKDYQKISDYINISNLQRYYEVSEKQSIGRYLNSHMFYIFGDSVAEINKDKGLNQAENYPAVNYLASLFVDQGYNRKINASILTAYSEENNTEFVCSRLYLNSNAIAIGNSINIITDFVDNYGAGNQAVPYTKTEQGISTQAYMNRAVPYSDKLGKIKHIDIQNVTDSNIDYSEATTPSTLEDNINKLAKSLPAITDLDGDLNPTGSDYITIADDYTDDNKPTFSNIGCKQDIDIYKDSREVIHINQQHHFLVNDSNIVIGNAMTEQCRFIQENNMTCRLVFLKDRIDAYEFTIKDSDIIEIVIPEDVELQPIAAKVKDLCDGIDADNLLNIISTTGNTEQLYILPNIEHDGWIVGLSEDAYAWAIITDKNELIIGKNENIPSQSSSTSNVATQINMSVTSEF